MSNTRREFMRRSVFAGAGMIAAPGAIHGDTVTPESTPPSCEAGDDTPYDVAVIGAGTAGTIAAIQAGRLGLRTLVEKNGYPAERQLSPP